MAALISLRLRVKGPGGKQQVVNVEDETLAQFSARMAALFETGVCACVRTTQRTLGAGTQDRSGAR